MRHESKTTVFIGDRSSKSWSSARGGGGGAGPAPPAPFCLPSNKAEGRSSPSRGAGSSSMRVRSDERGTSGAVENERLAAPSPVPVVVVAA